jgi:hypothetical protein
MNESINKTTNQKNPKSTSEDHFRTSGSTQNTTRSESYSKPSTSKTTTSTPESKDKAPKSRRCTSEYSRLKRLFIRATHLVKTVEENMAKGVVQTPENLESYAWAQGVIKKFEALCEERKSQPTNKATLPALSKRNRSLEGEGNVAKKHKPSTSANTSQTKNLDKIPLNEIVKQNLKVCIVDLKEPNWRIPADRFVKVDTAIIEVISKRIGEGLTNMPSYDMSERYFGFRIITCDSQNGLDLLKDIISSLGTLWEGADLCVKTLAELPKPPKARINIPGEAKKEDVIRILKISNPTLPIDTSR